jgi:hypothetical protein
MYCVRNIVCDTYCYRHGEDEKIADCIQQSSGKGIFYLGNIFTKQYTIKVEEKYLQSSSGTQELWLEVRVLKPIIHVVL